MGNTDTGHTKNVANLKTMNSYLVGYGSDYAPTNSLIKLAAMQQLETDVVKMMDDCRTAKISFNDAVDKRINAFDGFQPFCTELIKAVRTSELLPETIQSAESINNKIQGRRISSADTTPPPSNGDNTTEGDTGSKKISASQQSMDFLVERYAELLTLLEQQQNYAPAEVNFQMPALKAKLTKLMSAKEAVGPFQGKWTKARDLRTKLLYAKGTGLVDRTLIVKEYVEYVFKRTSLQAKQCRALTFKRIAD
jgi:hypothetical protein